MALEYRSHVLTFEATERGVDTLAEQLQLLERLGLVRDFTIYIDRGSGREALRRLFG